MASTNKTAVLNLNQWTDTDRPKRADFNTDNAILEAYLIAIRQVPVLTANRAVVSNGDGDLSVSPASAAELAYLDGVTSGIQAQLNAKQATIGGAATTIANSNLTVNRALLSNSSGKVAVSAVTSVELARLDGVTSGIQAQLNAKQANITGGASTIAGSNLTANRALLSNSSGKVAVSNITNTELSYLDSLTGNIQNQLNGKLGASAKAVDSDKWDGFHIVAQYAEPPGNPNVLWLAL